MNGLFILGIFLEVYGLLCIVLGIFKQPAAIWNTGKIQGFVKIIKETGTRIFLAVWGAGAIAGGIALILYNMPK